MPDNFYVKLLKLYNPPKMLIYDNEIVYLQIINFFSFISYNFE